MAVSIYVFVKQKLASHGAGKSPDGRITIENRQVFLGFVRLERAVRMVDFDAVQSAVNSIDRCVTSLGKHHLVAFAYLYIYFSNGCPSKARETQMDDGGMLRSVEYRRAVTAEERLISDWGNLLFKQVGRSLLQIVYASRT